VQILLDVMGWSSRDAPPAPFCRVQVQHTAKSWSEAALSAALPLVLD